MFFVTSKHFILKCSNLKCLLHITDLFTVLLTNYVKPATYSIPRMTDAKLLQLSFAIISTPMVHTKPKSTAIKVFAFSTSQN